MIMGDVNNNKTTVLERASDILKDNRLVPNGFTTNHFSYDTSKIDNEALADADFNKNIAGVQGNGKDIVHYHIPSNGYDGIVNVYANVFYQSVPPGWLQEMFSYSTALIDTFKSMYQAADKTPVLCVRSELLNIQLPSGIKNGNSANGISVYPSPSDNGIITIKGQGIKVYEIYSSDGKLHLKANGYNSNLISGIKLPNQKGIYFIKVITSNETGIFKILR